MSDLPPVPDPGAPYGRKANGEPKKSPGGRPPGVRNGQGRSGRATLKDTVTGLRGRGKKPPAAAPTRKSTPNRPPTRTVDFRPGIRTFATMIGRALTVLPLPGQAWALDGATLVTRANALADAFQKTAQQNELARRIGMFALKYSEGAELAEAFLAVGAQIAQNHMPALAPITGTLGAVAPEILMAQFQAHTEAEMRAAGYDPRELRDMMAAQQQAAAAQSVPSDTNHIPHGWTQSAAAS